MQFSCQICRETIHGRHIFAWGQVFCEKCMGTYRQKRDYLKRLIELGRVVREKTWVALPHYQKIMKKRWVKAGL